MQTGGGWPYINFSELNMDWIFQVLIPEVKSLKESYDNIQEIVRNVTQENYNQWKAELQTEMSRLQTQITQANESWKQTFTAQNAAWQQQAQNTLNTRFSEYVTTTNAAIETWEHDAYERLTQLINSFAESITEAEANAKAYADQLNAELRGYVEQQLHFLNDEIAATNLKLELQVNALNAKIAQLKSDMAEWQQQMQTEMDSFKQDVNSEVSEFEDRAEQKINQHKEWVQQQLASINNNIMEQVRLLNERISNLTAADIGAIDPITGEEEDVQFVLRHMFDVFSEYNGCITAGEYKQLGITAGEYKEKYNYNAILYSVASYWLLKIRKWKRPAFYYNGEYVTPAELEQRLMEYITKAAVDAELADYALTNDVDQKLAAYIKTKDMISYLATTLENYVTYDDLQSTLQDYARLEDLQQLQAELDQKATQEQLESLRQAIYNEFDNYAKVSELPDFSEFLKSSDAADTFATLDDLNKYALKTELPDVSGLLSKAEAADQYALKETVTALDSKVNTNQTAIAGALSQHIADANSRFALKSSVPVFKYYDLIIPANTDLGANYYINGIYSGVTAVTFGSSSPAFFRLVYSANPDMVSAIFRFNPSLESIQIDTSQVSINTTMLSILIAKVPRPAGFPLGNIRHPVICDIIKNDSTSNIKSYTDTRTGYFSIGCDNNFLWCILVIPTIILKDPYSNYKININLSSTGNTPTKRSE